MESINKQREKYLIYRTKKVEIPPMEESKIVRKSFIFLGKVQRVGFRLEVYEMGKRLGLQGWVRNREDGSVEAELQGEIKKIEYLIDHLKSLRRARIKDLIQDDMEIIKGDSEIRTVY